MADIMPFNHNRRLTPDEYEHERLRLREAYGDSKSEAGVRYEQELARLFYRSGWTQAELAKKEGKSKSRVDQLLRFGQFIEFSSATGNSEYSPKNLSEGRFGKYWIQTVGEGRNDRQRFIRVQELMAADLALCSDKRPQIGKKIVEQFADGKWHSQAVIASALETTEPHVFDTLRTMRILETYGTKCEMKKVGTSFSYRLFKQNKTIGVAELIEKLGPILKELKVEGKKNMATMSPPVILILAQNIQNLIDEWSK